MKFNNLKAAENAPNDINALIEIAANSAPIKYEFDKNTQSLHVDRLLNVAMNYPCNYGFIPQTLADDGDAVDVLVITPLALLPLSVIRVRPIGMLAMTDESGIDTKILAVPISKISHHYDHVKSYSDLPIETLNAIKHFFEHYKDLETGKWVKVDKWLGITEAHKEIMQGIKNYQAS